MKHPPVHYHDYLHLDRLLDSQHRKSEEMNQPAHDEMLFITVHQTYELWFKQILFEMDSVLAVLGRDPVDDREMAIAIRRLERVVAALRWSIGQVDLLETMTPLDFLDFREFLYPASGFQSFQFRLIEVKLGLREPDRLLYNQTPFHKHLPAAQQTLVVKAMDEPSVFDLVETWLERTPYLSAPDYDFWRSYEAAVHELMEADRQVVRENPRLSPEDRERNLAMLQKGEDAFRSLFDAKAFEALRAQGQFRLSAKGLQAALFIQIYRDEPVLQQPFRLLSCLIDLDEVMTSWRYRHAQMAMRMLGRKIGTGGSSGHDYLKDSTDKHRIFEDFTRLATFLIPRSKVPALPAGIARAMRFSQP